MRYFICILCLAFAACAEQSAPSSSEQQTKTKAVQKATDNSGDKAAALSLVREFSGDGNATVTITKSSGDGVCGVATINGQTAKFYADLVDEEAFIENLFPGADAIVQAAC